MRAVALTVRLTATETRERPAGALSGTSRLSAIAPPLRAVAGPLVTYGGVLLHFVVDRRLAHQ